METTKKSKPKQIGRPPLNREFTLIRVPSELHAVVRGIAQKEQRAVQIITERIMNKGLKAEGHSVQIN